MDVFVHWQKFSDKKFCTWDIQSVPELAYIPLTANVNIYSEMDSAKKNGLNFTTILI
jgi:hypothetical protein